MSNDAAHKTTTAPLVRRNTVITFYEFCRTSRFNKGFNRYVSVFAVISG
jgi:hypothetical protein